MGNLKIVLLLLLFTIERLLAACNDGLGMDADNRKIPDSSITASSEAPYLYARFGRLNEQYNSARRNFGGWCAYDCAPGQVHYLQVDLGKATTVTAVKTQAVYASNKWVRSYSLSYSYDNIEWHDHKVNGKGQTFHGNVDRYDYADNKVEPPLTARYVRIIPLTYTGSCPCMRAELYGCEATLDCRTPIGIDANIRNIPDKSMTASSEYNRHFAYEGRLNNVHRISSTGERSWGAWCPMKTDTSPYLQIDLGRVRVVSGVATQGYNYNLWTTLYRLNYSMDGIVWTQYVEKGTVKLFSGNSDNKTIRTHMLGTDIKTIARFIRFIPVRWNNYPKDMACMRVEVYECLPIKASVPNIIHGINNMVVNRGKSFNLTCEFSGQPRMEVTWQKNGNPLSTTDTISISNMDSNKIYKTSLNFKTINMGENGNTYSCTANYPGVNVRAASTALIKVDGSIPTLKIQKVGEDYVYISLGVTGSIKSDIVAYEVTLVDFATSEKIQEKYDFINATLGRKRIKNLKPFTKYNINVRFNYMDKSRGAAIPNQQFRTRECRPQRAPSNLAIKKMTSKEMEIHWEKPVNDPCIVPVTGYDVRIVRHDILLDEYFTQVNATKATKFFLKPIKPRSAYNVTVRAKTVAGPGPYTMSSITLSPSEIVVKATSKATTTVVTTATTTTTFTTKKTVPTTTLPVTETPKVEISKELVKIKEAGVTTKNVLNVTEKVEKLTNNSKLLNTKDISVTADILEKVVHMNGTSREVGEALVKTVSNVLNANTSVLEESYKENKTGIRYVKILESWLEKVDVKDADLTESSQNIIVKKIKIVQNQIKQDIVFEEKDGTSVVVPVEAIFKPNRTNKSNESIYFVYYKRNSFFTRKTMVSVTCVDGFTLEEKKVYTPVLASSIVGQDIRNLSKPITLRFKEKPGRNYIEKTACVYWDFHARGGRGDWSTKGCKLKEIVNKTIVCQCDHMTNFAAMMDVYAHTSKSCGKHGRALSYISVVGCFLSLIGLFLTMLTYAIFRRLRQEIAARIMLQLCFALFVVVVLFLTGFERTNQPDVCVAIGIAIHYFTLVAFMWMFMEAVFMYHAFVIVWPPREDNDVLKCSLAAWGIPGVIVAGIAAIDLGYYHGDHYCRVNGIPFYIAFLAPICLILLTNLIIFAIIMYKLSTRPNRNIDQREASEAMQRLKRAFGIMILMGLTWIFGALAVEDFRLVFQYFFAICNSLQGFAIFTFYCLSQKNVRDAWVAFFKCDTRSALKMRTDSYFERRRMSSTASQKSSMFLPRTRTNSTTVMMRKDSATARLQEVQAMLDEQANNGGIKMQTIMEMDIEDRFVDEKTSNFYVDGPKLDIATNADPRISASSADDETVKADSQDGIQPYRSYRALSESKEINALLSLADKRKSSSKSNEMLIRKSLIVGGSSPLLQAKEHMRAFRSCENVNNRRGSAELLDFATMNRAKEPRVLIQAAATRKKQGSGEVQPLINFISSSSDCSKSQDIAKSNENVNKSGSSPHLQKNDMGSTYKMPFDSCANTLDSNACQSSTPDSNTLKSNLQDLKTLDFNTLDANAANTNTLNSNTQTLTPADYTNSCNNTLESGQRSENSTSQNDTIRSESTKYNEVTTTSLLPPDHGSNTMKDLAIGLSNSHDDIVKWLHDTADHDDIPSDSSDEYRSSMCSSLNDIHSGLHSCRSSVSSAADSRRGSKRGKRAGDTLLGRMVVGPLRGAGDEMINKGMTDHVYKENGLPRTDAPPHKSNVLYRSKGSVESDKELVSEEGYSASEEETNAMDRELLTRNRKRTKSKNGSLGNSNGFIRSAYV